ncbi:MAG: hypothetical protein MZW92_79285 [Comamonadaceae bacterium]|nr:hypothetical protein [Comamonadaceae bacterium]
MAQALNVVGLMNVQFAIQDDDGLRARGEPARLAHRAVRLQGHRRAAGQDRGARAWPGSTLAELGVTARASIPPYFSVKEAVFPFVKFPGVDTHPRPGDEVDRRGDGRRRARFGEAFVKSQLAAGVRAAARGHGVHQRARRATSRARSKWRARCVELGFDARAPPAAPRRRSTRPASPVTPVNKVSEGRPHIVDMIKNDEIELHRQHRRGEAHGDRRFALDPRRARWRARVTYYTTHRRARAPPACRHARSSAASCEAVRACRPLHQRRTATDVEP